MEKFSLSPPRPRNTNNYRKSNKEKKQRMYTKEEQKSRAINVQVTIGKVQMAITIKVN